MIPAMRKVITTLLFVFVVSSLHAQDYGIRFFHGSWDDAVALARKEQKKIFIDFYTEWCGPCLNMALKIFTLPQVGEVYNRHFINLKIDAEKGEGRELARRYEVSFYPTYIFLDPATMEVVHRSGSNKPVEDFLFDADAAITPGLGSVAMEERYAAGHWDMDFLKKYIRFKKATGGRNQVEALFNRLIGMGAKLTDPDVWELYRTSVTGYANVYVKAVSDNYATFISLFGKEEVDRKLAEATAYAPEEFTASLVDFEGKRFAVEFRKMTLLMQQKKFKEAFAAIDRLIADPEIDQNQLIRGLSFYVRVYPQRETDELPFEVVAQKVKYLRYIAYNNYERDDASPHYMYALGMEHLMQRAARENKPIPDFLLSPPEVGKAEYDMRHPQLKLKPTKR